MANSEEMIDRIVAGVLGQLGTTSGGASSPPEAKERRPAEPSTVQTLEIAEDVVTAAYLENRGIISGPVAFAAKSVLTPSAREFLANRKIAWTRSSRGGSAAAAAGGKWLMLVVRDQRRLWLQPSISSRKDSMALGAVNCSAVIARLPRGESAPCAAANSTASWSSRGNRNRSPAAPIEIRRCGPQRLQRLDRSSD